ncbi:MAG: DNA polymerase III subunit gamma/tau [Anaerolineae bacterium]|nr:DNA polymerase III subunit gamma/tau [Anaerolineae bacterium]
MVQALYRRWRPQTFEQMVGQEHVVRTLRNALASGRTHHAYLFAGPRGTGKTTTARLLAKAVNCLAEEPGDRPCNACAICRAVNEGQLIDLIEIDGASNTGVDDVRELRERVGYRPNEARYKVYVIDEVHMLSTNAFNALLKTLEEPPPHVIFVLATTEPQKILPTILSRCQRFDFRRIALNDIVARLEYLAEQEGIDVQSEALTLIARQATGSLRDAESLLDQLAAYTDGGITVEVVRAALGTGDEEAVAALADSLADRDMARGLTIINEAVDQGADPRQFARQVAEHLRALLLTRLGSDATLLHVVNSQREVFQAQAARFSPHQLARLVRLFTQAAVEGKAAWQPQLPLELAFVEAALPDAEPPPSPAGTGPSLPAPAQRRPAPGQHPARQARAAAARTPSPPQRAQPGEPAVHAGRPEEAELPPASAPLLLEEIQARWADLLSAVRPFNLSLEALLRSGQPVGVEGDTLLIGFMHDFHKSKVQDASSRRIVEQALGKLLGQSLSVRCVMIRPGQQQEPAPPRQSPPAAAPSAAEDPLVQAAVQKLGAQPIDPSR